MSQKPYKEHYRYKEIEGIIEIYGNKSPFFGAWLCIECGDKNNCIGTSHSFDATMVTTKNAFERHVIENHEQCERNK